MQATTDMAFDDLVEQYLGNRLPGGMAAAFSMGNLSDEARHFVVRMLSLMRRSGYSVTEFSPHLMHWISATVPSILPGAWGGRIPPLTLPGRHRKLDDYIANDDVCAVHKPQLFVDVGCGFPPATSADTAGKFQNWQIYGVDRSFADYVLYDSDGHYACFDNKGRFLYFQALMNASGRALYADPAAARNRFTAVFEELFPMMKYPEGTDSETVEKSGNKLISNHIRDFETDNLTFIKSDFTELDLPPVRVIRCMNVLIYYEPAYRKQLLDKACELLADGGLFIAGTNGLGVQTRYAVYRKNKKNLILDEFAFGLDNVGHIVFMPFFCIHENDPEARLLADLAGTIRKDQSFWPEFSKRQDELLMKNGICRRNSNGFFTFLSDGMSPGEYLQINARIWRFIQEEGFVDRAVNILKQSGYDAWKNGVDDIAVKPSRDLD